MSALPGLLGRIAAVTSDGVALKLAQARGGTEMKFSRRKGGALAKIVGDANAVKIVELLGSERYVIPMAHLRGRGARQLAVAKALAHPEASSAKIALTHEVHERTARRIRERVKTGAMKLGAGPLFGED